ncbi:MAG TPA: GNAT family N-acetyltransferase [Candidatus Obscuribacterales bacterium]
MTIRLDLLSERHELSGFDCGNAVLNIYLQRYARQNQAKEAARTYVAHEGGKVLGYYTLVFASISWADAPPELRKGLGKYPVPALLIARLAVDKSAAGRGLGSELLQDALLRAIAASEIAGLRAVVVDAKDEHAREFYLSRGLRAFPEDPLRLFVTLVELKRSTGLW